MHDVLEQSRADEPDVTTPPATTRGPENRLSPRTSHASAAAKSLTIAIQLNRFQPFFFGFFCSFFIDVPLDISAPCEPSRIRGRDHRTVAIAALPARPGWHSHLDSASQ